MTNEDIRREMAINGVKQWQVAQKMGLRESAFCAILRWELAETEKEKLRGLIREIAKEAC